jgi:leucyl-tRNA synthetase
MTNIDMDFKSIEKKWQDAWDGIFQPEPKKQKKFYITVAFPYPSGAMHVGHCRTYLVPDVIARFKRAQGYNVLLPMAWHVTGTPIVGAVKRLLAKEQKQMHVLKDIFGIPENELKQLSTPIGFARYFIEKSYIPAMKGLGLSIDWRRQFTTNDPIYNQFISWQHSKLYSKGFERQGIHPVKWCINEGNPVTTHDLLEGESAEMLELTLLKFRFDNEWLIAATARPETVYGQTNLWIRPDIEYVRAKVGKEIWLISSECAQKLEKQGKTVAIIEKIKGEKFVGKWVTAPGINKKIPILPAYFCDPDFGSGIVTSVPSDAPWDLAALEELKGNENVLKKYGIKELVNAIKPIEIIQTEQFGRTAAVEALKRFGIKSTKDVEKLEAATKEVYKEGFHKGVMIVGKPGMTVAKAKEIVKRQLIDQGLADIMWDFTEHVKCRCGGKVVVALAQSWFIDYGNEEWKKKTKLCLKKIRTIPENSRIEYEHTIDWLKAWPCVRNFGLGTKLPQDPNFIIEPLSDSTIYMAFYTISHLLKRYKPEQLIPEFFDYVMLSKGNVNKISKKSGISVSDIRKIKKSFEYWYPLDWRASASELIQNHLTFMMFHHTALFDEKKWPKGIAVFGIGLLESAKMSSSKGNVILATKALAKWGADTIRLFLTASVEPWQDFDWKEKELGLYKQRLEKFYSKILQLWSAAESAKRKSFENIDRWLISELQQIILETTNGLENWQTRKAALAAFYRADDVIKWYVRRKEPNGNILKNFITNWLIILQPFIPHICEELWSLTAKKGYISLASWPKVDKKLIDLRLAQSEKLIADTLADCGQIIKLIGKKPKKVKIYIAPEWKHIVYNFIMKTLKPESAIKDIMAKPEIKKIGKDAVKMAEDLLKKRAELKEILTAKEEMYSLSSAKDFFERELGCEVEILDATFCTGEKAAKAAPGKPGIELVI